MLDDAERLFVTDGVSSGAFTGLSENESLFVLALIEEWKAEGNCPVGVQAFWRAFVHTVGEFARCRMCSTYLVLRWKKGTRTVGGQVPICPVCLKALEAEKADPELRRGFVGFPRCGFEAEDYKLLHGDAKIVWPKILGEVSLWKEPVPPPVAGCIHPVRRCVFWPGSVVCRDCGRVLDDATAQERRLQAEPVEWKSEPEYKEIESDGCFRGCGRPASVQVKRHRTRELVSVCHECATIFTQPESHGVTGYLGRSWEWRSGRERQRETEILDDPEAVLADLWYGPRWDHGMDHYGFRVFRVDGEWVEKRQGT